MCVLLAAAAVYLVLRMNIYIYMRSIYYHNREVLGGDERRERPKNSDSQWVGLFTLTTCLCCILYVRMYVGRRVDRHHVCINSTYEIYTPKYLVCMYNN